MSATELSNNVVRLREIAATPAVGLLRSYVTEAAEDEGDIILPFDLARRLLAEVES